MKNLSVAIILAFVFLATVSASDTVPLASIHIEIGKHTLALAEPVYLRATIVNNMGKDLFVSTGHMFNIHDKASRFSLSLITPEGEEWPFIGGRECVISYYSPSSPRYFLLPPNEKVTEAFILHWTFIVPRENQIALEKIPHGNYKLFAFYEIPGPEEVKDVTIYSDTIDLHFLPPRYEHLHALTYLDSLRDMLICSLGGEKARLYLNLLKKSDTPYREVAWAHLLSWTSNPEEFRDDKALFDEAFPESQFSFYLLNSQFKRAHRQNRTEEADSLRSLMEKETPSFELFLGLDSKLKLVTEKEVHDQ